MLEVSKGAETGMKWERAGGKLGLQPVLGGRGWGFWKPTDGSSGRKPLEGKETGQTALTLWGQYDAERWKASFVFLLYSS